MFTVDEEVIRRLNMKIKSMLIEAAQKVKSPIQQWVVDFKELGSGNMEEQVRIVWNDTPLLNKEYELKWRAKRAIISKKSS